MPDILWRQAFAFKHVPQMSAAFGTLDLGAISAGVCNARNSARYHIIKTWPSAFGFKLVVRTI